VHDMFASVAMKEAPLQADRLTQMINEGHLEWLDISWSSIGGNDIKRIINALAADTCVRHIDMSGYSGPLKDLLSLLKIVTNSRIIQTLNLSYCSLGDDVAEVIAELLAQNNSVKAINIILNNFTSTGLQIIMNGLKVNSMVRAFSVSLPSAKLGKNPYWHERSYYLREADKFKK